MTDRIAALDLTSEAISLPFVGLCDACPDFEGPQRSSQLVALGDVDRHRATAGHLENAASATLAHPCRGCEWEDYGVHRHDDAEDGPRQGCCAHSCGRAADDA